MLISTELQNFILKPQDVLQKSKTWYKIMNSQQWDTDNSGRVNIHQDQ